MGRQRGKTFADPRVTLGSLGSRTSDAFDRTFETRKSYITESVQKAAVYVNDTLELAIASAKQVFGGRFSPADVIEIYDQMNAEKLRLEGSQA